MRVFLFALAFGVVASMALAGDAWARLLWALLG
jgi:hypothetical protein